MKIDGSKNTLDSQNGKAYKARRKGFQAKQKYADGPFLRVYYYVRPAVKQKNRPREFPKGGIAWCALCTGGEGGISLIKDDPKISMSKMAEQTGYSAKQIEKTIDKLKARGIVSRSGADNGGVWIINE